DQLGFRLLFGTVTEIAAFKVGVQSARESHVGAVIPGLSVAVRSVVEMPSVAVVVEPVSEAIAGAIIVVGCAGARRIAGSWIVTYKTTFGRPRPMAVRCALDKA